MTSYILRYVTKPPCNGYSAVGAAVIAEALDDCTRGKECPARISGGSRDCCCRPSEGYHVCSTEAAKWLRGDEAGELMEYLGINQEALLSRAGIPQI